MKGLSNFELILGGNTTALHKQHNDVSRYVLHLPIPVLEPFRVNGRADSMVALLKSLTPQVSPLSSEEFKTLLTTLGKNPNGLDGKKMETLVKQLCDAPGITPKQCYAMLNGLCTKPTPIYPEQARALIHDLRTGGKPLTAAEVQELVEDGLRKELNPTETHTAVTQLQPSTGIAGKDILRMYTELCHTGGEGTTPKGFHKVVKLLRDLPNGTNKIDGAKIHALVHDLRTPSTGTGITGKKIVAIFEQLITTGGLKPAEAETLVTNLRTELTTDQTHDIIVKKHSLGGVDRPINAKYLHNASRLSHAGSTFAKHVKTCIASDAGGFDGVCRLVALMVYVKVTEARACQLLSMFPTMPNAATARHIRMNNFLVDGYTAATNGADWKAQVFDHLDNFVAAGRAPFGGNSPYMNVAFGSTTYDRTRVYSDATYKIPDSHLNYFMNAHTYAHLYFAERVGKAIAVNDMWPANKTRLQILGDFDAMTDTFLYGLATTAMSSPSHYAASSSGNTDIGLKYLNYSSGSHQFTVDHLQPMNTGLRISLAAFKALQWLFTD